MASKPSNGGDINSVSNLILTIVQGHVVPTALEGIHQPLGITTFSFLLQQKERLPLAAQSTTLLTPLVFLPLPSLSPPHHSLPGSTTALSPLRAIWLRLFVDTTTTQLLRQIFLHFPSNFGHDRGRGGP